MRAAREQLVSVVMPTYNRASLVSEAIDSVIGQQYPHWELFVVDDGSTDETREVLARYSEDSRITCLYQANAGQAAARNRGVRAAGGELVAFLDSDNRWLPRKLAVQVEYLLAHPDVDIVYGENEEIDLRGDVLGPQAPMTRYSGKVWRELLVDNFVNFNTAVARAEAIREVGGFNDTVRRGDDYDLWLRMSLRSAFAYLPGVVAQYRVDGERISDNVSGRFESNLATVERFIAANPSLLSAREVARVRARLFGRFARSFASRRQFGRAFELAARAIRLAPGQLRYWRTLAAISAQASGLKRT